MKKLLIFILFIQFPALCFSQDLSANDILKLYKMNFTDKDEMLVQMNYVLNAKDKNCEACGGTSTAWYAGSKESSGVPFNTIENNHWELMYYNAGTPLFYTTFSKSNIEEIKKAVSALGFKFETDPKVSAAVSKYKNDSYTLSITTIKYKREGALLPEGEYYTLQLAKKK